LAIVATAPFNSLPTVVKIWAGHRNVAQTRYAKYLTVARNFGDSETSQINGGFLSRYSAFEHAKFLKQIATYIHTLMARRASVCLKQSIAFLLLSSQRVALASKIAVEAGVWRQQRSLEARDRVQNGGARQPLIDRPESG
jgi:hypothetical protein